MTVPSGIKTIWAKLLNGVFDLAAKAPVINMKQFMWWVYMGVPHVPIQEATRMAAMSTFQTLSPYLQLKRMQASC